MMRYRDIRQLQQILLMQKIVAYLLILKYLEKIVKVIEQKDGKSQEIISSITYNTNGSVASVIYGNGIQTTRGYDVKGMLNSLNIGNLKSLSYTRDNIGNITSINDMLDPSKTKTYQYDALYRLTQATMGTAYTIQYNYDSVGNRTVETTNEGTTSYSYSANKLTVSTGVKNYSFSYDSNGNTITENNKQYTYNQNQRLIKAVENGNTLGEYLYNGNGQRVKKEANSRTTYFIYDQSGNLIEEADESGQINIDYIYLGVTPIARLDEWWEGLQTPQASTGVSVTPGDTQLTVSWNANAEPVDGYKVYWGTASGNYANSVDIGKVTSHTITDLVNGTTYYVAVTAYADLKETYFYHTDHLGTPILMTNGNGTLIWESDLQPFGERYSVKGKTTNNIALLGQYHDVETGLSYNWHRTQDPKLGRFTTYDPSLRLRGSPEIPYLLPSLLYSPQELNLYVYVGNNPVNFVDPYGLVVNLCVRQGVFFSDWGKEHEFYVIPHCYITAGLNKFSWRPRCNGKGGITENEKPINNYCNEIKCDCNKKEFEDCVIKTARSFIGREGCFWLPGIYDCCTWANKVVGECKKKHCGG